MEKKKVVVDLQQLDLLEQKIIKATEMIRALRRERDAGQSRIAGLEQTLARAQKEAASSEKERHEMQEAAEQIEALREERLAIRSKVTRMLELMAGLEDAASTEARREH